ncbi:hypothetical protein EDD85DRAFT_1018404 [Armillaria nabsnona]|nr:hypothetical protein EDD85DRAFT_1018404 [Armillaria nabsnona]
MHVLNLNLNTTILQALLHGRYTGVVAVTLWTMFSSPRLLRDTFLLAVIVTLYPLSTISFMTNWTFERSAFIEHSDKCYSVFTALMDHGPRWRRHILASAIAGGISTLLVNLTIIWRRWTIWDRQ